MTTIFSKIISKEIPSYTIYEDDLCIAFLDISQATKGHTLVLPKKEIENIFELDDDLAGHLFKIAVKIAKTIKKTFNPSGINILSNNGVTAFQSVMHFHIHIIPRYDTNEISIRLPNNAGNLEKADYEIIKNSIRNNMID